MAAATSLYVSEMMGSPVKFSGVARPAAPTPSSSATFKTVALFKKKAAAAPAKKAVAVAPVDEELAKWYGPDRRIFLPDGLLDRSEIPEYLNGEVPGDYGYDPFGLSKKPEDFAKYQAYELIHARWAMLGAAGFVIPEAFNKFGAACGPEAVWFKTGALLLDGNTLNYFGKNIPINLVVAVVAEVVLLGGAEYYRITNGLLLAVKKIDSSFFQDGQCTELADIASKVSKLHHPNIAEVLGYCSEQGQNMLIYEYFRNGSIHEFLHVSDDFSKPLTWNTRVRIALGAARAIEYLHEVCSPSCLHRNIKTSNILLDAELNPRLCECGLAMFHERASRNLDAGYTAPECTKPSAYTLKSDVYSFGIVMLELLTGRKPFDSSKPRLEQYVVQWASPQLHDLDALEKMADPALRGLYPPKSLSRFADITALCVQSEPKFRPHMSEVVLALVRLVQRSSLSQREDLSPSRRIDDDY